MSYFWQNVPIVRSAPTAFTPTLSNNTSVSTNAAFWWRDGKHMHIEGQILFSGGGTATALTITVPNSQLIDTSVLAAGTVTTNPGSALLGIGYWFDAGIAWKVIWPKFTTTSTIGFWDVNQAWANNEGKSGSGLNYIIRIPVVGWS